MFSLFRSRNIQAKKFNYTPRYYDPEQEEFRERIEERMGAGDKTKEGAKKRIAQGLRDGRRRNTQFRKKAVLRSNLVLIAIVVALCLFCYIFIQNYLPKIIENWFS